MILTTYRKRKTSDDLAGRRRDVGDAGHARMRRLAGETALVSSSRRIATRPTDTVQNA